MNIIKHVILCIIDDVKSTQFFNLINEGKLPNFKKMMESGAYCKNCITDFPSVTFPTQVSIITGTSTGDYRNEPCHGVPAYNWLDRSVAPPRLRSYGSYGLEERIQIYRINDDIGDNCQTLLEMVGNRENTASITQFINRGAKYFFPENKMKLALYYLLLRKTPRLEHYILLSNTMVIHKLLDCFKRSKKYFKQNQAPIASLIWFMTSDILMHLYGSNSEIYKKNLMHIDKVIGILLEELDNLGFLDETAIVVTSDHGNYDAKKAGNLSNFIDQSALTHYHYRKNPLGNVNIAEFSGIGMFNFKSTTNRNQYRWDHPSNSELRKYGLKETNLFEKLFQIEGVKLMYYRSDGNTYKNGSIQLHKKNDKNQIDKTSIFYRGNGNDYVTKYVPENPEKDIFNYNLDDRAAHLLDGRFHSIDEWLEATYHLDYPLYVDLLPRHFKNPRSADIIVSTQGKVVYHVKHGKIMNHELHCHDIGLRGSSVVPLLIGGTQELPRKEIPFCKITDIVPTLLAMLGRKPHSSVIGKSLV
jgi:hypothetical protein